MTPEEVDKEVAEIEVIYRRATGWMFFLGFIAGVGATSFVINVFCIILEKFEWTL